MNSCQFVGRMGKDPKFYAGQGDKKSYIMFSLAIKRPFAPQGQPDTDWLDFKAYGKTAEVINQYVPMGRQLAVNARAVVEEWTEQGTNQKRKAVKFYVDNCTLLDGKDGGTGNGGGNTKQTSTKTQSSSYVPPIMEDDDDLPF